MIGNKYFIQEHKHKICAQNVAIIETVKLWYGTFYFSKFPQLEVVFI